MEEKDSKMYDLEAELVNGQQQREQNANALEQSIAEVTKRLHQERSLKAEAVREVERLGRQLSEYNDTALSPSGFSTTKTLGRSAARYAARMTRNAQLIVWFRRFYARAHAYSSCAADRGQ